MTLPGGGGVLMNQRMSFESNNLLYQEEYFTVMAIGMNWSTSDYLKLRNAVFLSLLPIGCLLLITDSVVTTCSFICSFIPRLLRELLSFY
jgi:hypothetical protein